jgi:hypothetical protein
MNFQRQEGFGSAKLVCLALPCTATSARGTPNG